MPKLNFHPTHYMVITYFCSLGISILKENGLTIVQSAFFDENGVQSSRVANSQLKIDREGHPYFMRARQRYYLNDFIKKSPF